MPSSFILAPAAPSTEEEVHLLPFSLGYSGPAPVSAFFRPRPAPANHPYPGSTIASFRGRALVAQELELPQGYRGVILQAEATNYSGAGASAETEGPRTRGAPLTPAPSATSVEGEGRVTRSARAKGVGQVALARPRTQRATRTRNKRIALSDEEDEEEDVVKPMPKKAKAPVPTINAPEPEVKEEAGQKEGKELRERLKTPEVPAIVVLQATPGASQNPSQAPPSPRPTDASTPAETTPAPENADDSTPVKTEDATMEYVKEEKTAARPSVTLEENEEPSDVRVLYPSAAFKTITLWTPDAPMPGFVADELSKNSDETKDEKTEESSGLGQLRRSWWRQGGAGEGGDEFVRGLGEWIGLGEIVSFDLPFISTDTQIHKPVYLDEDDDVKTE